MSHDFRLVFAVSLLGTLAASIGGLVMPLVAATSLGASAAQMGWLAAAELLPFAVLALPAGPWIDRAPKRPVVIGAHALAATVAVAVPLAAAYGGLDMALLYAVGFVQGSCNVIGGTALQIQLLHVVGRTELLAANARINAGQSALGVVGALLTGLAVAHMAPALMMSANALCYALAAAAALAVSHREPSRVAAERHLLREIAGGLALIRDTPLLRGLALFGGLWLMLIGGFGALVVLYSTRDLGFTAAEVALLAALAGMGASVGALAARHFAGRVGVRATLLAGLLVSGLALGLYPAAIAFGAGALAFAGLVRVLKDFGIPLYTVNYISLRQRIVPDELLGRVIGAMRGIAVSAAPLGAIVWSRLAEEVGIAAAMHLMGACGVAVWWLAARRLPAVPA